MTGAAITMSNAAYKESRSYILRGLLMLVLASALLLLHKLPTPALLGDIGLCAGIVIMLLGNGLIIFGLLIYAGTRDP